MSIAEALMTVEEFAAATDDGRRTELVRGRTIEWPPPGFLHGIVCAKVAFLLMTCLNDRGLGRIATNDSGIITRRDPDTLRGADVAYYSFARLPLESTPRRYPDIAPDLVIEVRSPSDRWPDLLAKVAEYLEIGVPIVCVLIPEVREAHLFHPEQPPRILGPDDDLTFPECLHGFRARVATLFE